MNLFCLNPDISVWRLLVFGLLIIRSSAFAQSDTHYAYPADSSNGYWRLHTDYASRSTVIRFFDANRQLIYQETLRGRYVKLKKRNTRLFDLTLHRLINNQLLSSQVKSHELLAGNDRMPISAFIRPTALPDEPAPATDVTRTFAANPTVTSAGKLKVVFINPAQDRILISLIDDAHRGVYKELSTLPSYKRLVDITQLPEGTFTFAIEAPQRKYKYRLTIGPDKGPYYLRLVR